MAIFALVACVAIPQAALAQQVTATITGRVTDPSGAAVANAKV
jgi:protocatechuate 3,4-dioxygenase beta subunit